MQLPAIRPELRLVGRDADVSGIGLRVIYDPLRHRFFEIGPLAARLLSRWRLGDPQAVLTGTNGTEADLQAMVDFLDHNELLANRDSATLAKRLHRPGLAARASALLFFRIPLFNADRAITLLARWLGWLLQPAALATVAAVGVLGLLLVGRQWQSFVDTMTASAHDGFAIIALMAAVGFAKVVHETGHALAAKRMGCRVGTMGLAFMAGMPLLYTDLTDSWRLTRRRERLLVAAGGIVAETMLAALATWGWLLLPDGPARAACFFLAAVGWIATLVINLNPFMRFDGYFMLSDALGIPNLQDRSFALGRAALRRHLLGWAQPEDDSAPPRLRRLLVAFAWTTWAVRSMVFLGLAVMVYQMLPKAIGAPFALLEVWLLLARPVGKEIGEWIKHRSEIGRNPRALASSALAGLLLLFILVPQRFDVALPAVLAAEARQWMAPPAAAIVADIAAEGTRVTAGEVVARFIDPDLDHAIQASSVRLEALEGVVRQSETSWDQARELAAARERAAQERATTEGLLRQRAALEVRAPFDGIVLETAREAAIGTWRAAGDPVLLLVGEGKATLRAYVDDRDLSILAPDGLATFYPDAVDWPPLAARVTAIRAVPLEAVPDLLASINHGPIAAEKDADGRLVPRQGLYEVTVEVATGHVPSPRTLRGRLLAQSRPQSLIVLLFRRVGALVIREGGF